ncbi:conserved hypothetical protein [Leishmania braziliensis MHOM/BR/75/M2904]|uniref:Haloacid dehalogenase-like hydrolase-like protein n=1 Tax=Leishmania braziliensis TaxID=5660 RepID=A4HGJ0_LEIBR|nr:conserved hypothetical protein [Leishmania braziliensis MHOM/BR/75/M2904]CAJ2475851.1 unnamed protein product [Leishmania braziliensis]CAJ2476313.1 unnamed protein product [Leishmania braziliensis]CAM39683.1 conserved hypothetical protein [Leishmania braziliensis MHOM/BR/75/M2904]
MCQSAPFRIVASDMDGTVLNSDHEITEYTMETLFQLFLHYDVQFIFATGRHYLSVHKAREELSTYFAKRSSEYRRSVKSHPCGEGDNRGTGKYVAADSTQPSLFLVTSNGARIHDTKGKLIVSHDLDPDIVNALYQHYGLPYTSRHGPKAVKPSVGYSPHVSGSMEAAANGLMKGGDKNPEDIVSTSAYTTDEWFLTALFMPLPDIEKKFGVRPFLVPFDSEDPESASASVFNSFPLEGVGKVCFRCSDPSILDEMERSIRQQFGDRVSVALSSTRCLDVMPGNISKASALQEIVKLLSSESAQGHHNTRPPMLKDIIAFGDSMNDEAMLKTVGKGCIMKNAHERLKKALSNCEVIGSNEENGVAVKLREILQISLDP